MKSLLTIFVLFTLTMGVVNATLCLEISDNHSSVSLVGSDFTSTWALTCFMAFSIESDMPILRHSGLITDKSVHNDEVGALLGLDGGVIVSTYLIEIYDFSPPFELPNGILANSNIYGSGTIYLLGQEGDFIGQESTVLFDYVYIPEPSTLLLLFGMAVLSNKRKIQ